MPKEHYQDQTLTKPLPSTTAPKWAVAILFLSFIAGCSYFFGAPYGHIWSALPRNEYLPIQRQAAPPPIILRPAPPAPIPAPAAVVPLVQTPLAPVAGIAPTHPSGPLAAPTAHVHHHAALTLPGQHATAIIAVTPGNHHHYTVLTPLVHHHRVITAVPGLHPRAIAPAPHRLHPHAIAPTPHRLHHGVLTTAPARPKHTHGKATHPPVATPKHRHVHHPAPAPA